MSDAVGNESPSSAKPISLATLARFLIGDADAIRRIAHSRSALWLGLTFVIVAGFAREYDRKDLLAEPWQVFIPLAASLVISFIQFLLFWIARSRASKMRFGQAYRAFLTCFWMTAPLALLYAIPHERWNDNATTAQLNYITLAVVSVWRGAVICTVLMQLARVTVFHAFVISALLGVSTMLIALRMMPVPIFDVMGGLAQTRATAMLAEIAFFAQAIGIISLFVLVPSGLYYLTNARPTWTEDTAFADPRVHKATWLVPIAIMLGIAIAIPFTQPPVRLAAQANDLLADGKLDEAIALMSKHSRSDFPPAWEPLPIAGMPIRQPELLDVAERALRLETDSWVRAFYLNEFTRVYLKSHYIWANLPGEEWDRFLKVLSTLPEQNELRDKYADQLERNQLYVDRSRDSERLSATAPSSQPQ